MDPFSLVLGFLVGAILLANVKEEKQERRQPQPQLPPIKHFEVSPRGAFRLCLAGMASFIMSAMAMSVAVCTACIPDHGVIFGWFGVLFTTIGCMISFYVIHVGLQPGKPLYVATIRTSEATRPRHAPAATTTDVPATYT